MEAKPKEGAAVRGPVPSDEESPTDDDASPQGSASIGLEAVVDPSHGSILFEMAKQACTPHSPPHLPDRSLLEQYADMNTHAQLANAIYKQRSAAERMLAVCRWFVSFWHVKKDATKPFNPLLGETFRCHWDLGDEGVTTYIAEQVSHHPPMTAFYIENRKCGFAFNCHVWSKSRFMGTTVGVNSVGEGRLTLVNTGECYRLTLPSVYASGFFFGPMRFEFGDKCSISCEQTGYSAHIEFKTKGWFFGDYDIIEGSISGPTKNTIYTLNGKWNTVMHLTDTQTKERTVFFDPNACPRHRKILPPYKDMINDEESEQFESRRVWRRLRHAVQQKDWKAAEVEKNRREVAQRERRKLREQGVLPAWAPRHFDPIEWSGPGIGWRYKHINLRPPSEEGGGDEGAGAA